MLGHAGGDRPLKTPAENMGDVQTRKITVTFLEPPIGHRTKVGIWLVLAQILIALMSSVVMRRFGHNGPAFPLAAILAPAIIGMYLARCTCTVSHAEFIFRPHGVFGPGETIRLAEIQAATVQPGPVIALTLATDQTKLLGPWAPLTSFPSLDRRAAKCQTVVAAINAKLATPA